MQIVVPFLNQKSSSSSDRHILDSASTEYRIQHRIKQSITLLLLAFNLSLLSIVPKDERQTNCQWNWVCCLVGGRRKQRSYCYVEISNSITWFYIYLDGAIIHNTHPWIRWYTTRDHHFTYIILISLHVLETWCGGGNGIWIRFPKCKTSDYILKGGFYGVDCWEITNLGDGNGNTMV